MVELILGGARSGKSAWATRRAHASGLPVTFIATAQGHDPEMAERIHHHQESRPPHWQLVEEPLHLAAVLSRHPTPEQFLVVDCLTLWLANLLATHDDTLFNQERQALLEVLSLTTAPVVLVSNEVGLGVVPMGRLTRRFVDEAGKLHQELAERCHRVILIVAGLPWVLKEIDMGATP